MKNQQRQTKSGRCKLKFVETDVTPAEAPSPPVKMSAAERALADAREALTRHLKRAVEIIHELAEFSENDRVRLAAAQDLADRAGLSKTTNVKVEASSGEHEAINNEAAEVVARIRANAEKALEAAPHPSLEAIVVHESGDLDT